MSRRLCVSMQFCGLDVDLLLPYCPTLEAKGNKMRIEPELSEVAIVLVGNLNPIIFSPDWFARNKLLTDREAESAEVEVIHPQITKFSLDWLSIQVDPERFQAGTALEPYVRASDLVVRTFREFLAHTPLRALGINFMVHFEVDSFETRDRIGVSLAPKDPWGEWAKLLSAGKVEEHGGMSSLTMQQRCVDDRDEGSIQATVEPSNRVGKGLTGIYMKVNDHYQLKNSEEIAGASDIIDILDDRFEPSIKRAQWIIDQVMELAQ